MASSFLVDMDEYRRKVNLASDFDSTDEQKERDDFDYESRAERNHPQQDEPPYAQGDYWNDL